MKKLVYAIEGLNVWVGHALAWTILILTPPMAMPAYYLKEVLKKQIELMEIFKGIMPYLGIVIFSMVLMYQFPGIALWLPDDPFGTYVP